MMMARWLLAKSSLSLQNKRRRHHVTTCFGSVESLEATPAYAGYHALASFLTVLAVRIVIPSFTAELAVFDHQLVF